MTKLRGTWAVGLGLCGALLIARIAGAPMPLPAAQPTDGATLFKQQCATCHATNPSESVRQGPSMFRILGRPAGKVDGFHYSAGFAKADFVWVDAEHSRFERENLSPGPLRDFKHDGRTLARFFFVADPDGYKIEVIQRGGRFG